MADPRSTAGRAAAAAARASTAPGTGPAPAPTTPVAGAAQGGPVSEGAGANIAAVAGAAAGAEAANLAAGEADAARIAEHRDGTGVLRTGSFAEAAAAFADRDLREIPLLDGGPGIGAARIAERLPEQFVSRPIGTLGEELTRASGQQPRVPPVTKDVLPRSEFRVDPDTVPGHRYATAATQLRRNGRTYQPGVEVKVDYRAYAQLVAVGAIVADPWHRLSLAEEVEVPVSEGNKAPPTGGDAPKV